MSFEQLNGSAAAVISIDYLLIVECGGRMWGSLQLRSPNYPNVYPDSIDCYWYCTGLPSNRMNITLAEFNVEPLKDYVTVYDGLDLISPQIVQFTGTYTNNTKFSFDTDSKTLLIHFRSNKVNPSQYKGFSLLYKANM